MLASVRLVATSVVNHLDITSWYLIQRSILIYKFIAKFILAFSSDLQQVRGFPSGTPVSSTNKTDCHDIAEILLKVALKTIKQGSINHFFIQY
jgi:hypothetical protein